MLLSDYLQQKRKSIRRLSRASGIEESVLGKKVRSPGSSLQYIAAVKINVATEGAVSLEDLAQQYTILQPHVYSGRVGERIARSCAEGEGLEERLKTIGMNRRQLEYLLSAKRINEEDRRKLREAFRSKTVVLTDRDFERHARGK